MITIDTFQTYTLTRPFPRSYWVIPERFLAGEYPGSLLLQEAHNKITNLLNLGIDTFIDLTQYDHLEPYTPILKPLAVRMGRQFEYHKLGFRDLSVPSRRDMKKILDTIDEAMTSGHNVYVHCWGGIGRTGTVVGCYLARHGITGQDALEEIERMRVMVPSSRRSPETDEQRKMVLDWQSRQ
jgi:predicted protein tyrosine phosphatase